MTATKYLVMPVDQPLTMSDARLVVAADADSAISIYLQEVRASDSAFRDFVLDNSVNMSFAERFFLHTESEKERHRAGDVVDTEDEVISHRVYDYFEDRTDLGDWFVNYLATGDAAGLSEDLFTFVALHDDAERANLIAIDLDAVPAISA